MSTMQNIARIQTFGPNGIVVPKWSDTGITIHKVKYVWVIHNFNFHKAKLPKGQSLKSPTFTSATNNQCKWFLEMIPNGLIQSDDNNSSISLKLDDASNCEAVFAEFKISILVENRNVTNERASKCVRKFATVPSNKGWRFGNFIEDDYKSLLSNNKLPIYCEVTFSFADPTTNTFDQSSLIELEPNVPEPRLSDDFGKLLKNEDFTDLVFSINGKEYRAHKAVLMARSPVFAAMFRHENIIENQLNKIDIVDLDDQVVEEMLNYIYTGKTEKLKKLADGLLVAAEKYGLDGLKVISENVLIETVSVENAIDLLILADLHRADKLKSTIINFIVLKSADVMKTTAWKNLAPSYPQLLVELCEALSGK